MATIGDKKVSLALQDGSSINLNKPKVLPDTITKFADITEIGWYEGTITPSGQFPNRTCQISDCPDILPSYPYCFTLFVFNSRLNASTGMSYVYFGYDSVYVGNGYVDNDSNFIIMWRLLSSKEEVLKDLVVDNLTSTSTDKALSANQGKILKDIVDGLNNEYGTKIKIGDDFDKIWKKGFYYTEGHSEGEILHAPETVIPSFADGTNSGMLFYVHPVIVNDAYDDTGDGKATKMLVIANQYLLSYERSNASEHLLQYDAYASRTIRVIVNIADGSVSEYQGCNSEHDWRVMVADNLTTNDSSTALSAAQGKVLNDKVEAKMNAPIYSSTDLTPGTSDLADGQIYIVYYN